MSEPVVGSVSPSLSHGETLGEPSRALVLLRGEPADSSAHSVILPPGVACAWQACLICVHALALVPLAVDESGAAGVGSASDDGGSEVGSLEQAAQPMMAATREIFAMVGLCWDDSRLRPRGTVKLLDGDLVVEAQA